MTIYFLTFLDWLYYILLKQYTKIQEISTQPYNLEKFIYKISYLQNIQFLVQLLNSRLPFVFCRMSNISKASPIMRHIKFLFNNISKIIYVKLLNTRN